MEKLGLALVGRALLLGKVLIQLSADGWGSTPSLVVVWPEVIQPWGLWALYGRVNGERQEGLHQEDLSGLMMPVPPSLW